jgi:membrane-bound lytic murein transglycosylase A
MPSLTWRSAGSLLLLAAGLGLTACAAPEKLAPAPPPEPVLELRPTSFDELGGWQQDHPAAALDAFRRSCGALGNRSYDEPLGPMEVAGSVGDWLAICDAAERWPATGAGQARAFFEDWFQPYWVTDAGEAEGLFTGYYEPLLFGARAAGGPYTVPLYRAPRDLVRIDLARFDPELAGYSISGRIEGNQFVPYYSRAEIEAGALQGRGLELLWVDDAVDKFFLQIQGSGQVRLADGSLTRVGYAGQNGHPYRAIGRDLIELGALQREEVSLQTIRAWLEAHPGSAATIMDRNRSYIFFEERRDLGPDDGPLGAQGVPLTAGRSLAVDLRHIPLGAPVWLETTGPWPEGEAPFQHLMIAQDTGGAISGIVRGDVFFGAGARAEAAAGRMKSRGRYAILLPKSQIPTS